MTGSIPVRATKPARGNILAIILSNLDKNMDSKKMIMPQYQNATLSVEHTGMWRIWWYNFNPQTDRLERIRSTFNLNRIKDLKERKRVANNYIWAINQALQGGFNYFLSPEENAALRSDITQPKPAVTVEPKVSVLQALSRAMEIRKLGMRQRTIQTYTSFINTLSQWLEKNRLATIPVTEFTGEMFQQYLADKSSQGHGNRNLNDHINFFKTTFKIMRKKMKLIAANPLDEFEYLPEEESTLFEPLTSEEIERIVPVLIAYNPRFYLYTRFIAYEYIRPWHVARLRAGDITYNIPEIRVSKATTKNRKSVRKQLMQPIKAMLQEMDYHLLPGHFYLFGKNFEPSAELYPRLSITAAEVWKKLVIDGLGIRKKMYALKHTASQFFVNENDSADMKFLQQQMEHHSLSQTEIYLQNKVYKRIDEGKVKLIKY